MTREEAQRLVLASARKVAETLPENYAFEGQYLHTLNGRLLRLRRAIKDFDQATEEERSQDDKDA